MKIVINTCYGGFSVSPAVLKALGLPADHGRFLANEDLGIVSENPDAYRAHPALVKAVEELGETADGDWAELKVVEIPDDVEWTIEEQDGLESIHEKHRIWS